MAAMRRLSLLPLILGMLAPPALAADRVQPEMATRYAQVVKRAEAAGSPQAAIEIYEEALLGFASGYGRVHLRLGQLYQKINKPAEAAANYRACMEDDRVDDLDREIICKTNLEASTVPFEFTGLPAGGRVLVIQPAAFAGAVESGARLPPGNLEVTVEAPGRAPRASALRLPRARPWQVMVGLARRDGPLVPDGFLGGAGGGDQAPGLFDDAKAVAPMDPDGGGVDWRLWGGGGLGLALVGTGLALGVMSHGQLDDARAAQGAGTCTNFCADDLSSAESLASTADALWIGGAVVATAAVVWWLLD